MSQQSHAFSQEFPCPGPIAVTIRLGAGSIAVTAEDRPSAVVNVDPHDHSEASQLAAERTEASYHDGKLHIEVPKASGRMFRRDGQVRLDLRVPLDSRIQAHVGSADIRTEGRLAEAVVKTGSGDTYVSQVTGVFEANTGSGDVRADQVGELRTDTGSGDVSATVITGDAQIKTASGNIEIEIARGQIQANTASGDVAIRAAHGSKVSIGTASGDAEIGVPTGTRVWLDLDTASGRTSSELAMTNDGPTEGAQLTVRVRTASGDITLRRVRPATRTAT